MSRKNGALMFHAGLELHSQVRPSACGSTFSSSFWQTVRERQERCVSSDILGLINTLRGPPVTTVSV